MSSLKITSKVSLPISPVSPVLPGTSALPELETPQASPVSSPASPISSEDAFLHLVNRHFPNCHPHMLLGRGDDCAELACPQTLCMTSDLFLEDVHFRTSYFSYAEIGYKALAVNLSDIAACGGVPLGFNMNLILPASTSAQNVEALLQGMGELALQYDLPLTGGDLSQGDKLGICITIWGKLAGRSFLRRGGCKAGDTIFLLAAENKQSLKGSFPLGLARVGLLALEKWGRKEAEAQFPVACAAHLKPTPLLAQGQALIKMLGTAPNASPCFSCDSASTVSSANPFGNLYGNSFGGYSASSPSVSLMDLSDGLARDLPRLLGWQGNASDLGADINLSKADLPDELLHYCHTQGLNPEEQAMLGGEDYLLLGATSQPEILAKLENELSTKSLILGKVVGPPKQGIMLNGKPWQVKGFDHFCKAE